MRRELVWVIIIGISFGLIIAFGVWRMTPSLNKSNSGFPEGIPNSRDAGTELKITLNSPENNDVVTFSPLTVNGITKPLTWVTVSGELGDYILQSDEKGVFSQDIALTPGVNRIKLTAFDTNGAQNAQKVLVVYSSSFKPNTVVTATPGNTASGDAAIREKVAEKVAAALNAPKAYLGVVTDITSSTIQIKNPESQIEQVATGEDGITVVNTKGTNNKIVKLTDIAIGDFIVAMGYVNGDHVLKAQRILITDPLVDTNLTVSMGKVTKTSTKTITVSDIAKGQESTITLGKNTTIASFTKGKVATIKATGVAVDDLVIYIIDSAVTPPVTRSIFDI